MTANLTPIWDSYVAHRNLNTLREEILSYPWYEAPKTADESLLMGAVEENDLGAVRLLLSMGEDPQLPASDGFTFLHQAVDEIFNSVKEPTDHSLENTKHDTALAILTTLLEAGANPNVQGADGTPLHRAAGSGVIESAQILLAHGADIEARMLVDGELTPLMHAALSGQTQMVRVLLDAGADRSAMSRTSLTDPPMTLRELLKKSDVADVDKIVAMLDR